MSLTDHLRSKIEVTEGCWLWLGALQPNGYGRFSVKRDMKMAHRVVYEALVGPIPAGLTLDHLCRNRACVRPDHLEPVSIKENVLRGIGLSAKNVFKTHCPLGHEYTAENTRIDHRGKRHCRACNRLRYHRDAALAAEKPRFTDGHGNDITPLVDSPSQA